MPDHGCFATLIRQIAGLPRGSCRPPRHKRDPGAEPVRAESGGDAGGDGFEPDPKLRGFENVPLADAVDAYFAREVRPHVPDAWMDRAKDKVGCEINFNRHFYAYTPPRPLEDIDADLKQAEEKIVRLLREVVG